MKRHLWIRIVDTKPSAHDDRGSGLNPAITDDSNI